MPTRRHLIAAACAAALVIAGAPAWAAPAPEPGSPIQQGGPDEAALALLERPAKRFERSIETHLERVAAREARREARRQRRQARREARREARQAEAVEAAEGAEAADVAGADQVGVAQSTLDSIAACESGGDPGAVNAAGYYGKYQFDPGTWQSVGGSGNPAEASESEQDYRAALLYSRAGSSPWPVCGS